MSALLAEDSQNESMRGKVDLIYIDPPFDSKAAGELLLNVRNTMEIDGQRLPKAKLKIAA